MGRLLGIAAISALAAACSRSAPVPSADGAGEGSTSATPPTPILEVSSPDRGREIYLRGISPSGAELTAEMGARGGPVVPAASLPCVNCHGPDGRGRPEGGITPSNVRWESLTRPYEVKEASGRSHPPYDDRLAGRAITMGVDAAGQKLDDAMPRYRLSRRDLADVLAYLKKLSSERDPGLSDTEIRIGTLVPADGPLAPSGAAARALLAAFFADLDERGGIYGRRVELVTAEIAASGAGPERSREVERFLDRSRPFALTAILLGGDDQPIATLLEARQVPVIGAVTLHARTTAPPARSVFHLLGGLPEQALALATFASRQTPLPRETAQLPRLAIFHPTGSDHSEILRRIAAQRETLGAPSITDVTIDDAGANIPAALSSLVASPPDGLLLLGPAGGQAPLILSFARPGPHPLLLLPGALASEDLFTVSPAVARRIRVAFPVLPSDRTPEGMAEYHRLAGRYHLGEEHLSAQLSALAAAKVLVEGLTHAGREASRERLIASVEALRDFRTGLIPPLTFGKNRRIGAAGAHIVELDPTTRRFIPVGPWISAD